MAMLAWGTTESGPDSPHQCDAILEIMLLKMKEKLTRG
jgi:hypothetical protein